MFMDTSVRYLHNDMIKPSKNGKLGSVVDYETLKALLIDTTLRSFIPTQVHKMTPKLHQICGYDIWIIPKDIHIDLNDFRTGLVIYLQHKSVRRHTRDSLFSTTIASHYKHKVFQDGEFLQTTIKDAAQCITCLPTKPKNMIHIKCTLGFCDEYSK